VKPSAWNRLEAVLVHLGRGTVQPATATAWLRPLDDGFAVRTAP
jgi:hypothetical protein